MVQIASVLEKIFLHQDKPPVFRALIYAAYIVPPVAVGLLTWHEMTNTEMVWSSTEITRPHDAYRPEGGGNASVNIAGATLTRESESPNYWRPTEAYRTAFLSEFSKAYFGRSSRFNVFSPDMERASLTVILKNDASSRSILVNSISVVAMLEDEQPFDWRDLDVSTSLTVKHSGWRGDLTFVNTGTGPIVKLAAALTADGGWPFVTFQPEAGLLDEWSMTLTPADENLIGPFSDEGDAHGEVLYRVIEEGESVANVDAVIDCRPEEPLDDRCYGVIRDRYEEVTSITRLAELTDIQRAGAVDVDYSYEDLKRNPMSGRETIVLPTPLYWYQANDRLLQSLPLEEEYPAELAYGADSGGFSSDDVAGFGSGAIVDLAKQLFGVAVEGPKGVGLITTELDVDLADMPECGFARAIAEPRTLLQGGGFVSISVNLEKPKNGRYALRFLINGEDRHALALDFLVPDHLTFDGDVETPRFIDYEPGSPPACALPRVETVRSDQELN
jgi:hypothetical protein